MKITRKRVITGLAALIILLVLVTYFTSAERETKIAIESMTSGIKTIKSVIVKQEDIPRYVNEVGILEAMHQVTIIAESSGKVVKAKTEVGDRVRENDILFVLEDELPRLASEEARAGVIIAEASFEKAKKDLERGETLFETNDISLNELESLRLTFKNAEGSLLRARALLEMAEKRYADTRISSPIDGIVTSKMVDIGEMVNIGVPVAEVVDAESVKVTLGITDREILAITVGQTCSLSVDAFPGRRFPGRVSSASLKADEASGTFPVEVVAENTDELELKSGMVARVSIETGRLTDVICLPRDAIAKRAGRHIVFIVEEDKALERTVNIGPSIDEMIVVKEGISPGERVVVVGVETLTDGDSIREGT
ncbi:MAG: efflux RND transporter periplasmic adaptor subunit [Candidatus Glassbacteria bacterium]